MGAMLHSQNLQNADTQRVQATPWPAEVRRVVGTTVMVIRLSASSENTQGLKGSSNAKPTATPHRLSMVMVKQTCQRNNQKLGRAHQAVHRELALNL
jgi:hypothetical protein